MNTPNIIGGSRVACTTAIVLGSIVLAGLTVVVLAWFSPSGPAPADLHVGAGFFLGEP